MQTTDFLSLGIAPKFIVSDTTIRTANSKNGFLLYILSDCAFSELHLTFDRSGATDYGGLALSAGMFLPGVKTFTLSSGDVLVIDPK